MESKNQLLPIYVGGAIFSALGFICAFLLKGAVNSLDWDSIGKIVTYITLLSATVIGIIGNGIKSVIYYQKNEKNILTLVQAVVGGLFVLIFLSLSKTVDFEDLSTLTELGTSLTFCMILMLLNAIFAIVITLSLLNKIQISELNRFLPQTSGQTVDNNVSNFSKQSVPITINQEQIREFMKSKNGKNVIKIFVSCVVLFGAYKIYDQFFNYTKIDFLSGMTVSFEGYNTQGHASIDREGIVDFDINNPQIENFVDNVSYELDHNDDLKNGDKVTLTVIYSKETAKQLKLKVTEETREFEVKDLITKYQKASDISKDVLKNAYQYVENDVRRYWNSTNSLAAYKLYYVVEKNEQFLSDQETNLVVVYKYVDSSYNWETDQDEDVTKYKAYYINIDSSLKQSWIESSNEPDVHHLSLDDENYNQITEETQVMPALINEYNPNDYSVEEIPVDINELIK